MVLLNNPVKSLFQLSYLEPPLGGGSGIKEHLSPTLHIAYSSSATIVQMSHVVELVISETRRPFKLAEDSGLDYEKI